jgi:hypothetical protein
MSRPAAKTCNFIVHLHRRFDPEIDTSRTEH